MTRELQLYGNKVYGFEVSSYRFWNEISSDSYGRDRLLQRTTRFIFIWNHVLTDVKLFKYLY